MGRLSREHKDLTRKVLVFLLKPEETQKKIKVCQNLLGSVLKSRGARKGVYLEQLSNTFKNLCVDSTEKTQLKIESQTMKKEYNRVQKENAELHNELVCLQNTKKELETWEKRFNEERKAKRAIENQYGKLLRENQKLQEKN